jgi:Fe-S cluster assembly iron-binding protein IscA
MALMPQSTMLGWRKSGGCSLSYDLKFDKTKGEDDKIFVDNNITIAVEKNLSSLEPY